MGMRVCVSSLVKNITACRTSKRGKKLKSGKEMGSTKEEVRMRKREVEQKIKIKIKKKER